MSSTAACTQALLSGNLDGVAAQRSWEGFRNAKAQGKAFYVEPEILCGDH